MKKINPEFKGIAAIVLIALIIGIVLAGSSGKLEQWGLPWFTGAKLEDKVVFVSDRSGSDQLYSMNLDGSDQKQLTSDIKVLSAPAISVSGNRTAFVGMLGTQTQVFSTGANGGSVSPLTTSGNSKRQPSYSPDGKKLAYIESGRVFISELSGANPDPVLPTEQELSMAMNDPSGGHGAIPMYSSYAWGPDSESLAAVTKDNGIQTLVYLPKPEAETQRFALGDPTAQVTGLSWATDRALLAASIEIGEKRAMLIVFDPDAKQPQVVFSAPMQIGSPAMSPDGSAVYVPVAPKGGILKVDLRTGKATPVCKGIFEKPTLSPKGDAILAAQIDEKTKKRSIVTIDPESGKITTLAEDGDSFDAVWSPQSK